MVNLKISAWLREKTLTILADTFCQLFLTGWLAEVSSRAADIMDISFKIGILCHFYSFFQNRFMTSGLKNPSLMKGQGAEIASAETAAITGKTELNLFQCRNSTFGIVHRMPGICIWQIIDIIHLLLC